MVLSGNCKFKNMLYKQVTNTIHVFINRISLEQMLRLSKIERDICFADLGGRCSGCN